MIYVWDMETRDLYGDIIVIGVFDGKDIRYFYSVPDFKKFLDEISVKHEKVYLFAHNHEFDLLKLIQYYMKKEQDIEIDLIRSTFTNRKAINLIFKRWRNVFFRDTYRIFNAALAKVTSSFECQTKKIDLKKEVRKLGYKSVEQFFRKVEPNNPLLLEYLRNDVVGLYEALQKFIEITRVNVRKLTTIASVAMEMFSKQYTEDYNKIVRKKNGKKICFNKEVRNFIRECYKGGRVEVIRRKTGKGYAYDVNSLYPYIMWKHEFPTGRYTEYKGSVAQAKMNWLIRGVRRSGEHKQLGVAEVTINIPKTKIPPLPVTIGEKLYFVYGKQTVKLPTSEIIHAVIKYDAKIEKVHRLVLWDEKCRPFKGIVEQLYKVKSETTEAKKQVAKLLMISLYGKFGMREIFEKMVYKEDYETGKIKQRKIKRKTTFCGKEVYVIDETVLPEYTQPHIAAYITSYSRLELLYKIEELLERGYEVWYYDTDCIHTNCPPNAFGKVHKKKLGWWSLDFEFNEAGYIAPKSYGVKKGNFEKVRMKEIPKQFTPSYQKVKEMLDDKKIFEKIFEGEKVPTLWKQLISNKIIEKEKIQKTLCLINEKRKNINEEETEPWHIDEVINIKIKIRVYQKNGEISKATILVNDREVDCFDDYVRIINNNVKVEKGKTNIL